MLAEPEAKILSDEDVSVTLVRPTVNTTDGTIQYVFHDYINNFFFKIDPEGIIYFSPVGDSKYYLLDDTNEINLIELSNYLTILYAQSIIKQLYSQGYDIYSLEVNDDQTYTVILIDGTTKSFDEVYGGGEISMAVELAKFVTKTNNTSLAGYNKRGLVKTTSTITDTDGLIPTPIINGIPYYKETDISGYIPLTGTTKLTGSISPVDDLAYNLGNYNHYFLNVFAKNYLMQAADTSKCSIDNYNGAPLLQTDSNYTGEDPHAIKLCTYLKTVSNGSLTWISIGESSTSSGAIKMYGNSTGYTKIINDTESTNVNTISLPDKSGTMALDVDIPSVEGMLTEDNFTNYAAKSNLITTDNISEYTNTSEYYVPFPKGAEIYNNSSSLMTYIYISFPHVANNISYISAKLNMNGPTVARQYYIYGEKNNAMWDLYIELSSAINDPDVEIKTPTISGIVDTVNDRWEITVSSFYACIITITDLHITNEIDTVRSGWSIEVDYDGPK